MHFKYRILVTKKILNRHEKLYFYTALRTFDTRCTDWDQVTVKFVALTVFPSFPDGKKVGRSVGFRFRPQGLRFRQGLRSSFLTHPVWIFYLEGELAHLPYSSLACSRRMTVVSLFMFTNIYDPYLIKDQAWTWTIIRSQSRVWCSCKKARCLPREIIVHLHDVPTVSGIVICFWYGLSSCWNRKKIKTNRTKWSHIGECSLKYFLLLCPKVRINSMAVTVILGLANC